MYKAKCVKLTTDVSVRVLGELVRDVNKRQPAQITVVSQSTCSTSTPTTSGASPRCLQRPRRAVRRCRRPRSPKRRVHEPQIAPHRRCTASRSTISFRRAVIASRAVYGAPEIRAGDSRWWPRVRRPQNPCPRRRTPAFALPLPRVPVCKNRSQRHTP